MNIESKNLLVALKAYARANAFPLDKDEIWESLEAAQNYVKTATAYAGQTIKVLKEDGKYHTYVLQPSESGLVLEELDFNSIESKKYVQIVESLPLENQSQDIFYINISDNTGNIWTGTEFKVIFRNFDNEISSLNTKVESLEKDLSNKANVSYVDERVGDISKETTVKEYIDMAISSGSADAAGIIAQAKADAIAQAMAYTDEKINIVEF